MKRNKVLRRSGSAALLVVLALLLAVAPTFGGGSGNPIPPDAHPHGHSYGVWAGQWWIWAFGIPADKNPLVDAPGATCAEAQSDHVWFLGGTFVSESVGNDVVGEATRSCTIPAGNMIFFPVLNAECSTAEGNGTTYQKLIGCAKASMDAATVVRAVWDGTALIDVDSAMHHMTGSTYRVESPLMTFTLPDNNILKCPPPSGTGDWVQCPAGPSAFATDGYYLMLTPPSTGDHTLHIYGEVPINSTSNFVLSVTYNLHVSPAVPAEKVVGRQLRR